MLKKLYRKFTLLNASVLILSLIIFSFTVFFLMNQVFENASYNFMRHFSDQFKNMDNILEETEKRFLDKGRDIQGFKIPRTKIFKASPKIEFILFDKQKNIIFLSDKNINTINSEIILKYLPKDNKKEVFKNIHINDSEYRLYSKTLEKQNETIYIQIYQNKEYENAFLYNLFIMLIVIGFISVVILIAISQWLAKKSLVPVKNAWEQQREFVANASHELRTPLTVIQTNLEAALYDKKSTIMDNELWLDNAYQETKNMSNLINELLLLAKIDARQVELKKEMFNLSQLSNNVSEKILPIIEKRNLKFQKYIEEDISFYGDETKIGQLLLILLDNAIKYNKDNGWIFFNVVKEENNIIIKVKDTGIGIKNRERIYERFYMEDKSRSKAEGSYGLGLNIANWIVTSHNGKIQLETEINVGSTFIVYL